jgi:hypothetical protein
MHTHFARSHHPPYWGLCFGPPKWRSKDIGYFFDFLCEAARFTSPISKGSYAPMTFPVKRTSKALAIPFRNPESPGYVPEVKAV